MLSSGTAMRRGWRAALGLAAAAVLATGISSYGAERMVLGEYFTNTT